MPKLDKVAANDYAAERAQGLLDDTVLGDSMSCQGPRDRGVTRWRQS